MAYRSISTDRGNSIEVVVLRDGVEISRETKKKKQAAGDVRLGDELKETLESYGVTIEWCEGLLEAIGLPPSCDCPERQEWLNEASKRHPVKAKLGVGFLRLIRRRR
jgi:hypothetical protein